jgi:hypothetical protein
MKILEPIQEHPINLQTPSHSTEVFLTGLDMPPLNERQRAEDQLIFREQKMEREAALHAPFMEPHKQKRTGETGDRPCKYQEVEDVAIVPEAEEMKLQLPEREEKMVPGRMQCGGELIIIDKMEVRREGEGQYGEAVDAIPESAVGGSEQRYR